MRKMKLLSHLVVSFSFLFMIFDNSIARAASVKQRLEKARREEGAQKTRKKNVLTPIVKPSLIEEPSSIEAPGQLMTKEDAERNIAERKRRRQEKLQILEEMKAQEDREDRRREEEIRAIVEDPNIDLASAEEQLKRIQQQRKEIIKKRYQKHIELFKKDVRKLVDHSE